MTHAELQDLIDQSIVVRDMALAEAIPPPEVATLHRAGFWLLSLAIRDRTLLYKDGLARK